MRKAFRRLLMSLVLIIVLVGGSAWWLMSYIAPDERRDLAYEPVDVKEKALDMIKGLKPELILTEADANHLIKMHLENKLEAEPGSDSQSAILLAKDIRLDGAEFELEENKLVAHMNVTYKERIPAQLDANYSLEWQSPNLVLSPQSLSIKKLMLPLSLLEPIVIPLDLPGRDIVTVSSVKFQTDQIKVQFELNL